MSTTGSSSVGDSSGGNYNYLSVFASGSYGRKLEGQRSRDPTLAMVEEEKRLWKRLTAAAVALMVLINLIVTISLVTWRKAEVEKIGYEGNIVELIHHNMKHDMKSDCRPRYRKTQECSQMSSQIFLVKRQHGATVTWSDKQQFSDYSPSFGAFRCSKEPSRPDSTGLGQGIFKIEADGFYQIHSHVSVKNFSSKSAVQFHHAIYVIRHSSPILVAEQTLQNPGCDNLTTSGEPSDAACISSFLVATEYLYMEDVASFLLQVNGMKVDPTKVEEIGLVSNGRSTYFSIVRLGRKTLQDEDLRKR